MASGKYYVLKRIETSVLGDKWYVAETKDCYLKPFNKRVGNITAILVCAFLLLFAIYMVLAFQNAALIVMAVFFVPSMMICIVFASLDLVPQYVHDRNNKEYADCRIVTQPEFDAIRDTQIVSPGQVVNQEGICQLCQQRKSRLIILSRRDPVSATYINEISKGMFYTVNSSISEWSGYKRDFCMCEDCYTNVIQNDNFNANALRDRDILLPIPEPDEATRGGLFSAAKQGDSKLISELCADNPAILLIKNHYGVSPLLILALTNFTFCRDFVFSQKTADHRFPSIFRYLDTLPEKDRPERIAHLELAYRLFNDQYRAITKVSPYAASETCYCTKMELLDSPIKFPLCCGVLITPSRNKNKCLHQDESGEICSKCGQPISIREDFSAELEMLSGGSRIEGMDGEFRPGVYVPHAGAGPAEFNYDSLHEDGGLPHGGHGFAPETVEHPVHPEGSVVQADGTVALPDGALMLPQGATLSADGMLHLPNGTVVNAHEMLAKILNKEHSNAPEAPAKTRKPDALRRPSSPPRVAPPIILPAEKQPQTPSGGISTSPSEVGSQPPPR